MEQEKAKKEIEERFKEWLEICEKVSLRKSESLLQDVRIFAESKSLSEYLDELIVNQLSEDQENLSKKAI